MKALVLDQSTTCTGYALVDSSLKGKAALLDYGQWKPSLPAAAGYQLRSHEGVDIESLGDDTPVSLSGKEEVVC